MNRRAFRFAAPAAMLLVAVIASPAAAQYPPPPSNGETVAFELTSPEAVCVDLDIPYLRFSTTFTGSMVLSFVDTSGEQRPGADDLGSFDGAYANDGGSASGVIRAQYDVDVAGGEVIELLWPGMVLDDDGEPIAWPNWEPVFGDGGEVIGWDEVDDGFSWARTQEASELGVFATLGDDTTDLYAVTYVDPDEVCFDPDETEVGGIIEEDPDPDVVDPGTDTGTEVAPEVTEREEAVGAAPTQVLGVSLVRTGIDAIVLALVGIGLLGLGFLAIRRTREQQR